MESSPDSVISNRTKFTRRWARNARGWLCAGLLGRAAEGLGCEVNGIERLASREIPIKVAA